MADGNQMTVDLSDGALFGNDAGEDELPDILNSYFVDQIAFKPFFSKENPFQVARSRKGMGKSALLNKLAYDLGILGDDYIVINVTGANLIGILPPPRGASYLELQNYWVKVICARINFEIGKSVGFAFTETDMALVESSEIAGFKERNIVGSLIQRVKSSKIPIEITLKEFNNHEELLKRALEKYDQKKVWLLVDDIDSTYVDTQDQQAVTSTFFSACRALVREVDGLFIRASVRSDVWKSLRNNEDLDKCEQYIIDIYWSVSNLKILLSKKIYAYFKRNSLSFKGGEEPDYKKDADDLLLYVFTSKMTWGGARFLLLGQ